MTEEIICAECGRPIVGEPVEHEEREGLVCEICATILTPTGANWMKERLEQYRKRRRANDPRRKRP